MVSLFNEGLNKMRIKKGYFNLINMQFTLFSSFQAP